MYIPPAIEVSREVANLTERKNPHTAVYGVKEFVCLSFLAGNNYPDSPHSQGGMKFATQISPLLNYQFNSNYIKFSPHYFMILKFLLKT